MNDKKFAVLIDADNTSAEHIGTIIDEMTNEGVLTYKRIYGDWTKPNLSKWKKILLEYSISPIQQFANTKHKNSTDSAMIIDAMDILYADKVDGFCLVSSDSDFTRLAARLREAGMTVIGMGNENTPKPFVSSCGKFKYLDVITASGDKKLTANQENTENITDKTSKNKKKTPINNKSKKDESLNDSKTPIKEIKKAISRIIDEKLGDDGWVLVSNLGNILQNKYSDFDVRNYGYKKMSDLLQAQGFEINKFKDENNKGNPTANVVLVRKKQ